MAAAHQRVRNHGRVTRRVRVGCPGRSLCGHTLLCITAKNRPSMSELGQTRKGSE
jgi:hypothetical protein